MPTGNFGNVLAAWAARRMGLPVARLIVGSNRNDILARFLAANDMSVRGVEPSLSPSMDIQVSSNFERLLFELLDRDPAATAATMRGFRDDGPDAGARMRPGSAPRALFHGFRLDDAGDRGGDPPPARATGLPRRPAHRHRHRRRPGAALRPRRADGRRRHGASGEVPRRDGARDRHPPRAAAAPADLYDTGRTLYRWPRRTTSAAIEANVAGRCPPRWKR